MTIYEKITDEKLHYDINRGGTRKKHQNYHHVELINMSILQGKRYCLLIKVK